MISAAATPRTIDATEIRKDRQSVLWESMCVHESKVKPMGQSVTAFISEAALELRDRASSEISGTAVRMPKRIRMAVMVKVYQNSDRVDWI